MKCAHGIRIDKACRYCTTGTEPATPSVVSAGSTGLYAVDIVWESGRKESQLVDAKDEYDAILKTLRTTFGLTKIVATCVR